jgi:hypothetical protein
MEQVLDRIPVWGLAIANLMVGGVLAIVAVAGHVKEKRTGIALRSAILLLATTALIAVGFLVLLDIAESKWADVNLCMVFGLLLILAGTGVMSTPLTGGIRKWLSVAFGASLVLWALLTSLGLLRKYWS